MDTNFPFISFHSLLVILVDAYHFCNSSWLHLLWTVEIEIKIEQKAKKNEEISKEKSFREKGHTHIERNGEREERTN